MIKLVRDLRVINVLAKFENDPWKSYGRESVNGDIPCAKLENAKKNSPNFVFGDYETKTGTYIDCYV